LALYQLNQFLLAGHRGETRLRPAERVGRHQAVTATVPARWVRIRRIGQDGQADRLAVDRPRVIAPGRLLPPADGPVFLILLADLALGVLDHARPLRLLLVHHDLFPDGVVDADAHRAFLGVAERDRASAGVQVDVQYQQAGVTQIVEMDGPRLVEDLD